MGDHFDFRGTVYYGPVVGKSVQVTTQVTEVARPDDKFYVVMKGWEFLGDSTSGPDKVAMSLKAANDYVSTRTEPFYVSEGVETMEDGTAYHSFTNSDGEVTWYWVESVDAV